MGRRQKELTAPPKLLRILASRRAWERASWQNIWKRVTNRQAEYSISVVTSTPPNQDPASRITFE